MVGGNDSGETTAGTAHLIVGKIVGWIESGWKNWEKSDKTRRFAVFKGTLPSKEERIIVHDK